MHTLLFGAPRSRVDGPAKVTGMAKYAADFQVAGLLYGWVVSSAIARGRILRIDEAAARAVPGVVEIYTHANRRRTAWFDSSYRDDVAPPGSPFRPLHSAEIQFSLQPVALVVAETLEAARYAATRLDIGYEAETPVSDLRAVRDQSYEPPRKRSGVAPAPKPRGGADDALRSAALTVEREYSHGREYHNPMEPHATTVEFAGGKLVVHDKIQGVMATQKYLTNVFGLSKGDVHIVSPFVGGAFGSGLRPQYQLFLAVMAALELQRSVRVVMTREQMFSFTYRPETIQPLSLGADAMGKLAAIRHEAIAATSRFEDYQEAVVNWSGLLYACDNTTLKYRLAQLDSYTPGDMRAPGAPTGMFALECAMDELATAAGVDPLQLRLLNYAERDQNEDMPFTSKALRQAYSEGAIRFGWGDRSPAPGSMRDGDELIGWGMATGAWESPMQPHSAIATLDNEGKLTIGCATADIGTGMYTILSQIAADALGVEMDDVTVRLADSDLPAAPVEGGSWGAASAGTAVQAACAALRQKLFSAARAADRSPLANADPDHVDFTGGRIALRNDPSAGMSLSDAVRASGEPRLEAKATAQRDRQIQKNFAAYTHAAVFVEVRIDQALRSLRVARVVSAIAAGAIINPKTARSQIIGGVVMGIGMALHEDGLMDHRLGRVMNHNFAEYHIPVNADIEAIDVIFVDEPDDRVNPMGIKGLGEIGIVGTAAAIANAVHHATGRRLRVLPMTIDALLD